MKIISKQGGGPFLSTVYSPVSPVDTATPEKKSADGSEDSEKLGSKKSIIEQIFDPKMNVLPSDGTLLAQLAIRVGNLESSPGFQSLPKTRLWAAIYSMYITMANQARNNYELLTEAKSLLLKSGAVQEVATTSEGYLFVHKNGSKEISLITPEQFDRSKDKAVTNAELIYLRANNPDYAFNDKLSETIMGGTSLKEIREIIKDSLAHLKETKILNEFFVNPIEMGKTLKGLEALKQMNITAEDLRTMDPGTLIKLRVENTTNAAQVEAAVQAIFDQLTPQQIALLKVRAKEIGGKADATSMILEYANSALKNERSITLSISNTYTSGNAEARTNRNNAAKQKIEDESKLGQQDMPPSVEFLVGYGEIRQHRFSDGSRGSLFVEGNELSITSKEGKGLGLTTMNNVRESSFAGGLDYSNVTIGGEIIDELKFDHILAKTNKVVNAPLPIDLTKFAQGIITPDINATKRLHEVWKDLTAKGITGKTELEIQIINNALQQAGLPAIFKGLDGTGMPIVNVTYYRRFAVMSGYVDGAALPDNGQFSLGLTPLEGNNAEAALKEFRKNTKGYKGNERGWWGHKEPDIYEGTIFIPINNNPINAYAGSGVNLTVSLAENLTRRVFDALLRAEQPKVRRESNYNFNY